MVKLKVILKLKKKEFLLKKFYNNRILFHKLEKEFILNVDPENNTNFLKNIPNNSSSIRYHNYCWITGRTKGNTRMFSLSRHFIRNIAKECVLPGLKKSSW